MRGLAKLMVVSKGLPVAVGRLIVTERTWRCGHNVITVGTLTCV